MNKEEITIVALLFMLLMGWMYFQQVNHIPPPQKPHVATVAGTNSVEAAPAAAAVSSNEVREAHANIEAVASSPELEKPGSSEDGHSEEEEVVVLSNGLMNVSISSWGGGVVAVELKKYRAHLDKQSVPMRLDFAAKPALSLIGIPGLSTNNDCTVDLVEGGKAARIYRKTKDGLEFRRTITIADNYRLKVTDSFSNTVSQTLLLPPHGMVVGPMPEMATMSGGGYSYLGLDTLAAHGGENVTYWAGNLPSFFGRKSSTFSCAESNARFLPAEASHKAESPVSWVAAKNKFFVQILSPASGSADCELHARRDMTRSDTFSVATVYADLILPEKAIQPGESFDSEVNYYVGPKEYSSLKLLGNHQDEVMEFGKYLGWLCPPLLLILNEIHKVFPNYGAAVILLTCVVRFVLWPITRKATLSMKEMQKVQPLVNELREKYKDKPQRMNQEIMALYKEHKVNPMAGCLPILVQIPVFFALFTVLRSAVELRFAHFLWIKDLSEPEGLFAQAAILKVFPLSLAGSINLLPLLMTATTIWQTKLTPSAGNPQQQKMMMWMPVIFLVMFYNMASALVLYWTVSQLISIAGLYYQKYKTPPTPQP